MRRSRLPKKYSLVTYHGYGGLWTRVKAVDSIAEAERFLHNRNFHSAELWERRLPKVVKKFKGKHLKESAWLR